MSIFSRLKSITLLAALFTFILPLYTHAGEHKWLKTLKYQNIFVYTDFNECDFIEKKLKGEINASLLRSGIRSTISDSLIFQSSEKGGKSIIEEMNSKLLKNNKILLYVYGKCIPYKSVHIYQFNVNFAIFNTKFSQALLYITPRHSVMGADTINGIQKAFKRIMDDAVADYISANKEN